MKKILHIVGSPRGGDSVSLEVANAYISACRVAGPNTTLDILDVWAEELPELDDHALKAKYAGLAGATLTPEQQHAWDRLKKIAARFKAADVIVFSVPMWNFGIPYKLKHLIDLISQKDVLFTFDEGGFGGMLAGRKAVLICARGLNYATDTATPETEFDHQKSYMRMWLKFVGITDVDVITVEKTLLGAAGLQVRQAGIAEAQELARENLA